jgi:phage pi2 protein 07
LNSRLYTPKEALKEIEAKTAVGLELKKEVECLKLTDEAIDLLALPRIKKRLEKKPLDEPYVYYVSEDGLKSYYTRKEIIEAIEKKTDIGKMHIKDERRYLKYLYSLR